MTTGNDGTSDNVTEIPQKGGDKRSPMTKALEGIKKGKREALENKLKDKVKLALEQKEAYDGTITEIAAIEVEIDGLEKLKL